MYYQGYIEFTKSDFVNSVAFITITVYYQKVCGARLKAHPHLVNIIILQSKGDMTVGYTPYPNMKKKNNTKL